MERSARPAAAVRKWPACTRRGAVLATAAAFSHSEQHPFLVVGTASGGVHLWKPPAERKPYVGMIVFVESSDANKVNVRVEMNNSSGSEPARPFHGERDHHPPDPVISSWASGGREIRCARRSQ